MWSWGLFIQRVRQGQCYSSLQNVARCNISSLLPNSSSDPVMSVRGHFEFSVWDLMYGCIKIRITCEKFTRLDLRNHRWDTSADYV